MENYDEFDDDYDIDDLDLEQDDYGVIDPTQNSQVYKEERNVAERMTQGTQTQEFMTRGAYLLSKSPLDTAKEEILSVLDRYLDDSSKEYLSIRDKLFVFPNVQFYNSRILVLAQLFIIQHKDLTKKTLDSFISDKKIENVLKEDLIRYIRLLTNE